MSLLNFSTPYLAATPNPPLTTNYYHNSIPASLQPLQPLQPPPYSYPTPQKPFLREDYPSALLHHHNQQQPSPQHYQPQQQQHQQSTYTKVTEDGAKTKVHAVIDYDDYNDDEIDGGTLLPPAVTPIQGPIYIKNGSVPVVPLYSHPVLNNGSFVQIPILWTALSVALGLELRGEYIRGVPCIKRHQQLFCPTAGNSYPLDRIELFIDENKALMKRMYGEFDMGPPDDFNQQQQQEQPASTINSNNNGRRKRSTTANNIKNSKLPGVPDLHFDPGPDPATQNNQHESYFNKIRTARQNFRNTNNNNNNQSSESGRVDACESKVEIVTPYWASNSAGKIRAIVNTQHFEQAIHQEVCAKVRTNRCTGDCGCEQKYKWHRLLAYDPDNDCKGIFMDWFLFPSCCVCRCNPT